MEPEPTTLKELIAAALDKCTDVGMLDLVYKLLLYDNIESRA